MKISEKEARKSMIKVRGGYSDISGIRPVSKAIQVKEFDDRTRTLLCNELRELLEIVFEIDYELYKNFYSGVEISNEFCKEIISEVFAELNTLRKGYSYKWRNIYDEKVAEVILKAVYNEVLDMIWYICDWITRNMNYYDNRHYKLLNKFFEKECIGYRFVSGKIIKITNKIEIAEIEKATTSKYDGVNAHIRKAVSFLADHEKQDYKNCIKESISAVESICKVIIGKDNATLGEALKILESKRGLKGQLKSAFEKMYNYTNGQGGIRHAEGLFVSEVTFEEAKFMLVSCSAFVNYLVAEFGKIS